MLMAVFTLEIDYPSEAGNPRRQIPSKLTEKHMDNLKQIIRPKLNRPVFILLRTVRLTDNPYL